VNATCRQCALQALLALDLAFFVFDALMHMDKSGSPAPLILKHSLHHLLASAWSQTQWQTIPVITMRRRDASVAYWVMMHGD